ncbi:flagellar basal body-associated protein FliL [Planctomycetota bacterium]
MAEPEEKKEQEEGTGAEQENKGQPQQKAQDAKIGIVTWAMIAVVVIVFAGSGLVLGRVLAAMSTSEQQPQASGQQEKTQENDKADSIADTEGTWYYNGLESVVVNPDEPGAMRYVRVGLTLEVSSELDQLKAEAFFETKKPALVNWLNIYLKSLTLGEMENDSDMKHILLDIHDAFNEILFPDEKPKLKRVLIREFNIQ